MPVTRSVALGWRCGAPLGLEQHAEDDPRRRTPLQGSGEGGGPVARDFAPGWRRVAPLGLKQYAGDPGRCDAPLGLEQHAEDDPRRRTPLQGSGEGATGHLGRCVSHGVGRPFRAQRVGANR